MRRSVFYVPFMLHIAYILDLNYRIVRMSYLPWLWKKRVMCKCLEMIDLESSLGNANLASVWEMTGNIKLIHPPFYSNPSCLCSLYWTSQPFLPTLRKLCTSSLPFALSALVSGIGSEHCSWMTPVTAILTQADGQPGHTDSMNISSFLKNCNFWSYPNRGNWQMNCLVSQPFGNIRNKATKLN